MGATVNTSLLGGGGRGNPKRTTKCEVPEFQDKP